MIEELLIETSIKLGSPRMIVRLLPLYADGAFIRDSYLEICDELDGVEYFKDLKKPEQYHNNMRDLFDVNRQYKGPFKKFLNFLVEDLKIWDRNVHGYGIE